jgi:hypothetical protein
MKIGIYTLDENVRSHPELSELSPLESAILEKAHEGERTYKGVESIINGCTWAFFVAALADGKIYKIAAQFMSDDAEIVARVHSETLACYERQFGKPQHITPSGAHLWNQPFGNLLLGKAGIPGMSCINLIATSQTRPVSQPEKKQRGCLGVFLLLLLPVITWLVLHAIRM